MIFHSNFQYHSPSILKQKLSHMKKKMTPLHIQKWKNNFFWFKFTHFMNSWVAYQPNFYQMFDVDTSFHHLMVLTLIIRCEKTACTPKPHNSCFFSHFSTKKSKKSYYMFPFLNRSRRNTVTVQSTEQTTA